MVASQQLLCFGVEQFVPPCPTHVGLQVLQQFMPLGWFGHDKDGNPIRYERVGRLDPRGLMRSACKSDILKFRTVYMMEDALRRCKEVYIYMYMYNSTCSYTKHRMSSYIYTYIYVCVFVMLGSGKR